MEFCILRKVLRWTAAPWHAFEEASKWWSVLLMHRRVEHLDEMFICESFLIFGFSMHVLFKF